MISFTKVKLIQYLSAAKDDAGRWLHKTQWICNYLGICKATYYKHAVARNKKVVKPIISQVRYLPRDKLYIPGLERRNSDPLLNHWTDTHDIRRFQREVRRLKIQLGEMKIESARERLRDYL